MEEDLSEVAAEVRNTSSSLVEAKQENLFIKEDLSSGEEEEDGNEELEDEETSIVTLPLIISELDLPVGGNQGLVISILIGRF